MELNNLKESLELIKKLFDLVKSDIDTFTKFCEKNNISVVDAATHYKDANGVTFCHLAVSNGNINLVKYFEQQGIELDKIKDRENNTLLHSALSNNQSEIASYLVKKNLSLYDVNKNGYTCIQLALERTPTFFVQNQDIKLEWHKNFYYISDSGSILLILGFYASVSVFLSFIQKCPDDFLVYELTQKTKSVFPPALIAFASFNKPDYLIIFEEYLKRITHDVILNASDEGSNHILFNAAESGNIGLIKVLFKQVKREKLEKAAHKLVNGCSACDVASNEEIKKMLAEITDSSKVETIREKIQPKIDCTMEELVSDLRNLLEDAYDLFSQSRYDECNSRFEMILAALFGEDWPVLLPQQALGWPVEHQNVVYSIFSLLATANDNINNTTNAIENAKTCVLLEPNNAESYKLLSKLYAKIQNFEEAAYNLFEYLKRTDNTDVEANTALKQLIQKAQRQYQSRQA